MSSQFLSNTFLLFKEHLSRLLICHRDLLSVSMLFFVPSTSSRNILCRVQLFLCAHKCFKYPVVVLRLKKMLKMVRWFFFFSLYIIFWVHWAYYTSNTTGMMKIISPFRMAEHNPVKPLQIWICGFRSHRTYGAQCINLHGGVVRFSHTPTCSAMSCIQMIDDS